MTDIEYAVDDLKRDIKEKVYSADVFMIEQPKELSYKLMVRWDSGFRYIRTIPLYEITKISIKFIIDDMKERILDRWTIVNKLDRKKEITAWKNTSILLC